jgi:hypothetical protein
MLRASAVLGANDGILSTSSRVLGVAARACDSWQRRLPTLPNIAVRQTALVDAAELLGF